jgi:uncharacterized protein
VAGLLTTPGVRRSELGAAPVAPLATGVPVLLGYCREGPLETPAALLRAADFAATFGAPGDGYLGAAVAAFFRNGGERCAVVRLADEPPPCVALAAGLDAARAIDDADLVCAPDAVRPRPDPAGALPPDPAEVAALQRLVLEHCTALQTRVAILDALPAATPAAVAAQAAGLNGDHAALYYPWVVGDDGLVPPCGHVAGAISSSDRLRGVHWAPANVALDGVSDLELALDDAAQGPLHAAGVNCLRAFPGRGVRVWGARTLSRDPAWQQLNVRRLVCSLARWIARSTRGFAFEPGNPETWARVQRTLAAHLGELFRAGATPAEAFAVHCDARTNPPEVRAAGQLVVEVMLAPAAPIEVIAIRIVRLAAGVSVEAVAGLSQ